MFKIWGFPHGSVVNKPPANAKDAGEEGSIFGSRRSPGEGNGNPLQYFCLGNSMNRGSWQAIVHGVVKSQTWPSAHAHTHMHTHTHAHTCAHTRAHARTHMHTHTHTHTVFKTYCVPATFTRHLAISTFKHLLLRNIPLKIQQQCTYELITNYYQWQPQRGRNALNQKAMVWRQPWLGFLSRALLGE